jgi:hypothetical protein
VHAWTGDSEGEEAFYSLSGWTEAKFAFNSMRREERRTLTKATITLLMEAMRRIEEQAPSAPPSESAGWSRSKHPRRAPTFLGAWSRIDEASFRAADIALNPTELNTSYMPGDFPSLRRVEVDESDADVDILVLGALEAPPDLAGGFNDFFVLGNLDRTSCLLPTGGAC